MINTILTLILIQIITVNLIDLSGIVDTIKHFLWKKYVKTGDYHNLNLKPFSCSYCMNHHIAVIYLLIIGKFTFINYTVVLILSLLTPITGDLLLWLKDTLTWLINKMYKLLDK